MKEQFYAGPYPLTLEEQAKAFATKAHDGQVRKYSGAPYIIHPEEVASIVRNVPHTEAQLCAAWLHDTVEDCGINIVTIIQLFGDEVAEIVLDLTNVAKLEDGNRAKRKNIELAHTFHASPKAKTVKLADLISNSRSIVQFDPNFAKVYMREKELLLEVLKDGDPTLWLQASNIVEAYFAQEAKQ